MKENTTLHVALSRLLLVTRREYRLQERSNVSLRCCVRRFPTDYSIDQHAVAMRRTERKGRLWALALLRAWKSEPMPMQFPFPHVFALGLVDLEERVHRDYRQILCDYDRSAVVLSSVLLALW